MHIAQLQVENFRNLANQLIPLSPSINLITGDNGAGKTALLEAIYFLGRQKSFRTAKNKDLVQQDTNYFRLIAKTTNPDHQIGLERRITNDRKLSFTLRIDRQTQKSPAQLAKIIPTIAITARSFQLIDAGPQFRRQFIDYGTFHFDMHFFQQLQTYQIALKNRNSALKQKMSRSIIDSFTPILADSGTLVHEHRLRYFEAFKPLLTKHLEALNFPFPITMRYMPGWNTEENLLDNLNKHFYYDYRLSHTRNGPHRADIKFSLEGGNAENRLSRGQQKTLILAMHLAQIDVIHTFGNAAPLLIFDDIAAELDTHRRNFILHYLSSLDCQMFFSATEPSLFDTQTQQSGVLIHLISGKISSQ